MDLSLHPFQTPGLKVNGGSPAQDELYNRTADYLEREGSILVGLGLQLGLVDADNFSQIRDPQFCDSLIDPISHHSASRPLAANGGEFSRSDESARLAHKADEESLHAFLGNRFEARTSSELSHFANAGIRRLGDGPRRSILTLPLMAYQHLANALGAYRKQYPYVP